MSQNGWWFSPLPGALSVFLTLSLQNQKTNHLNTSLDKVCICTHIFALTKFIILVFLMKHNCADVYSIVIFCLIDANINPPKKGENIMVLRWQLINSSIMHEARNVSKTGLYDTSESMVYYRGPELVVKYDVITFMCLTWFDITVAALACLAQYHGHHGTSGKIHFRQENFFISINEVWHQWTRKLIIMPEELLYKSNIAAPRKWNNNNISINKLVEGQCSNNSQFDYDPDHHEILIVMVN